jgi:Zn-dependent protease with chaperone function
VPTDGFDIHNEYIRNDPFAWMALAATLGAAYLVARLVTWLALFVALRRWARAEGEHWAERARLAWPGRKLMAMTPYVAPAALLFAFIVSDRAFMVWGRMEKFAGPLPAMATNGLFLAVCLVGVLHARSRWERRVNPAVALTPRNWRWSWISSAFLFIVWSWIAFIFCVRILGLGLALELAIIAGVTLVSMAYLTWGQFALLRWAGIIRPASDRLRAIVATIAERMDVRPKRVEEIALPMANALAFVFQSRMGVTDAALAVLNDEELSLLCAHELAHLGEPRRVRVSRFLYILILTSWICSPALFVVLLERAFEFEADLALFAGTLFVSLCGSVFYFRLHHRMEIRADTMALQLENQPGTYARMLEKLYETNGVPVVLRSSGGSHPELYDRMVTAGVPPDYPRPAVPPKGPYYLGIAILAIFAVAGGIGLDRLAEAIS